MKTELYRRRGVLRVGDRISIRPDRWPLLGLRDQTGTIVRVLDMPRHSYLVRVDGDLQRSREWFFYHTEVAYTDEREPSDRNRRIPPEIERRI